MRDGNAAASETQVTMMTVPRMRCRCGIGMNVPPHVRADRGREAMRRRCRGVAEHRLHIIPTPHLAHPGWQPGTPSAGLEPRSSNRGHLIREGVEGARPREGAV